jgi:signal transduction histidine kinase
LHPSKPNQDTALLRRRSWHNWLLLAGTCVLSTLGLVLSVALSRDPDSVWPWRATGSLLLMALVIVVVILVHYLTFQQRRVLQLISSNADLTREISSREQVESELRSERELLEQRVMDRTAALEIQSQRLLELYRAAHEFVGNVSHEFRTPLTVIKAYAGSLKDELRDTNDPTVLEHLQAIENRVGDLTLMVDDLLDFNRIEAGILRVSRRVCRLEDVFESIWETLERRAAVFGIELAQRVDPDLPPIYCDMDKIGRVVLNLTVNALKFSERGTGVEVWARHEPQDGRLRIGVTDSGPGIAAADLKVIFQRFKQVGEQRASSTKGLGLGLHIAEELVHLNWGTIQVESQVGVGSTFSFTVPIADPEALLRGYLRSECFRRPPMHISLVLVKADAELQQVGSADVGDFLERQTRREDFLYKIAPDSWLLGVAGTREEVTALLMRLTTARHEANLGQPLRQLPGLRFRSLGTYGVADGATHLIDRFIAATRGETQGESFQNASNEAPSGLPETSWRG